ncbi:hypothetical protein Hypma_016460 [Hypsizygus marmoreus]|uniref:Uncharacterized protein n=1 Tax=Hypsizygus marmoreus TaxID=39966 RepID=A0A369IXS4_HYPMA|nr:hypothetical protein Hypma_016460 [Hypsizygus marmoreus]
MGSLPNNTHHGKWHQTGLCVRWKAAGVEEGCVIETIQKRAGAGEGGSNAKETGTDEEIVSTASEANGYPGCYEAEA